MTTRRPYNAPSDEKWAEFFLLLTLGVPRYSAGSKVGIDERTITALFRNPRRSTGYMHYRKWLKETPPDPIPTNKMNPVARRAYDDFEHFRRRYFGHVSKPWHVEAATKIVELLNDRTRKDYLVINCPPGSGKALALDTPLATPTGWTTMGEVEVGDHLIGRDGRPVVVLAKTDVLHDRDCYAVVTDDGHRVVADAEHEWPAVLHGYGTYKRGPKPGGGSRGPKATPRLYTSRFLAQPRSKRPVLPLADALDLPDAPLPVDPWVLGAWLGDGASASGRISAHPADQPYMREAFEKAGYTTTDIAAPSAFGVLGLQRELRHIGVLNDKHIPAIYLRASREQRLALLQGLVDTDGHVEPGTGRTEFTTTRSRLADDVVELVASLGVKVSRLVGRATLDGRDCGPKYRVCFSLAHSARMPRKAHGATAGRGRYLTVVKTESVPVACVQVEGGEYLAGHGMLLTHNSTLLTHDTIVWALVRNRGLRTMIGTGSSDTGQDYLRRIRTTFERIDPIIADERDKMLGLAVDGEAVLTADYGRFRPDDNTNYWNSDKLVLAREGGRPAHQKEASVSAWGRKSQFLGQRYDFVVWDDVVTFENSRTPKQRDDLAHWWRTTAESRLEPGGLIVLQGQRLGAYDLYRHALDLRDLVDDFDGDYESNPDHLPRKYVHVIYKAHYDNLCAGGDHKSENHHPSTAKAWPDGCLLDPQRLTYRDLWTQKHNDPGTYATVYQQEDGDPEDTLVHPLWINGGTSEAGETFVGCWDVDRQAGAFPAHLTDDVYSHVSIDPSPTAFWGCLWLAYDPESTFTHVVDLLRGKLDVNSFLGYSTETGRWSGLLEDWWQQSKDIGRPIGHVIAENNAAQRWLLQYDHAKKWSQVRGVDLVPHATGFNKSDPALGVGSLSTEFRYGRIRLPGHPLSRAKLAPLVDEVTRYPDAQTSDRSWRCGSPGSTATGCSSANAASSTSSTVPVGCRTGPAGSAI